jgi:hypothetical protein
MPTKRKSWTEKLADSKGLPQVEKITEINEQKVGHRHSGYSCAHGSRRHDEKSA